MKKKKVLVIGSRNHGQKNDPVLLSGNIASDGILAETIFWEDMCFEVFNNKAKIIINGVDLVAMDIDLILSTGWYKSGPLSIYRDMALSLALVLDQKGIEYWNSEMGNQRSTTKLSATFKLASEGIDVIDTRFSLDRNIMLEGLSYNEGHKWILKDPSASRGRSNYLITSEDEADYVLSSDRSNLILQPYIENDHDIRVICYGGKPAMAFKRSRPAGSSTHLNNTSSGGVVEVIDLLELDSRILNTCVRICRIFSTEMAGIDLIPDAESSYGFSVLEVNVIPQLTSGFNPGMKMNILKKVIREHLK